MLELLESYQPVPLEDAILAFYRKHHIANPDEIDLDWMAREANIWIHYKPHPSASYELRGMWSVIVDDRLPEPQQRVELAHELGHVFLHVGHQIAINADLKARQEWQADRFAMYLLCPTPMIADHMITAESRGQLVDHFADTFNVPDYFMDARLKLLEQRLQMLAAQRQFAAALESLPQYGRDYDQVVRHPVNPRIEYYLREGRVVYQRKRAEV
ncbi:ImmA/IrrE family metallo-endopeptidase [Effusibacillus pohliae]|uniref:ImmA/IrrE family metallo-endopeptidase n=1 Tax=Effusibacillus pohliae TaxID=232270 RepID=UPI0003671216|nr:ImmA/IrrE family metallo-endopeptidase [Effusibacillus pohliae]